MLRKIIGIAAPARSGKDTVASMLLRHQKVAAYALADPLKIGCQALFGLTDAETWDDGIKENRIALWQRSPREFFQRVGTDWMRAHNPEHWLMRAERAIHTPIRRDEGSTPPMQDAKAPFKQAAQAFFDLSDRQTWDNDAAEATDRFWNLSPSQMFDLIEALTLSDFPDYFARRAQRPITEPTRTLPSLGASEVIVIKDIRFENEADFLRRHNGILWHIVRHDAQKVNAHSSELGIAIGENDVVIHNNGTLEQLAVVVEKAWRDLRAS